MDFQLDHSWTIFLDRDGVINERIIGGYVTHPDEFQFLAGVPEAIFLFRNMVNRIVVVTNQQGIAKKIFTTRNLEAVHRYMREELNRKNAFVDGIYFAPEFANDPNNTRKPKPDMAYQVKKDFPEVDFSKSLMVGDTDSDILFGKNLGMKTARIITHEAIGVDADMNYSSLYELAKALNETKAQII